MNDSTDHAIRPTDVTDAETIGQLLHDFNREFEEPTQGQGVIAERIRQLLDADQIAVLLGGTEPHGLVLLRFCAALYAQICPISRLDALCSPSGSQGAPGSGNMR